MERPESKPFTKRLRRWIVALALLAASAVSWWYWPRGDARFVGRWDLRLGSAPDECVGVFELQSHGSGWHPMMRIPFWIPTWKVRQDELIIGSNSTGKKSWLLSMIDRPLVRWTGLEIDEDERIFTVLAVTPQRIDLRMKADGRDFFFLRMTD